MTGIPRYETPPVHVRALDQRIRNIARAMAANELRLRRTIANTVVAQVLPGAVVKGGAAVKFRIGEARSRFTQDLDAARHAHREVDEFIDDLATALPSGWSGFTGRVVRLPPADPDGVPAVYIMQPFDLKLAYRGQSWLTVRFELGHDELGSTAAATRVLSADIIEQFDFPANDPGAYDNRYILALDHPSYGKIRTLGFPIWLSDSPAHLERLAPCVGQHTDQVLQDLLGYSRETVHELAACGAVA